MQTLILTSIIIGAALCPQLSQRLATLSSYEKIEVIVHMKDQFDITSLPPYISREEKIELLQRHAQQSQKELIDYLQCHSDKISDVRSYWIFNGFSLKTTNDMIFSLAQRADIDYIIENSTVALETYDKYIPDVWFMRNPPWNIRKVMADSCWSAGYDGEGIIIGNIDTGVDIYHPALQGKWYPGGWYDAVHGISHPYDEGLYHGTFVMGIICGGDGDGPFGDDIGVAPGLRFVCAKAFDHNGVATYTAIHSSFQWLATQNVQVVNITWSDERSSLELYNDCKNLKDLGIILVGRIGAENPPAPFYSAKAPANYPIVVGVGATDSLDNWYQISCRGPAPDTLPWNDTIHWQRPDWNLIKPDIVAPGYNIRSAGKKGSYYLANGVSWATAHVTGAVAILLQKNPSIDSKTLYKILLDNADHPAQGSPYPNNTYGWGRLNIWKALQALPMAVKPYITFSSYELADPPPGGNNNGMFEPGETIELVIKIKNIGADGNNVECIIESEDNYVSITDGSAYFGNIPHGDSAMNISDPYIISAHHLTPSGHIANFELIITANGDSGDFCDTFNLPLKIGNSPSPFIIFEDDFEYGNDIDSLRDYWSFIDYWQRSTAQSHSPPYSLYNGGVIHTTYEIRLKNSLNLTSFRDPKLAFWHTYNFDGIWCRASIGVSTNGGLSWTTIWEYDGLSGNNIPWTPETLLLASYISNNFKIRYYLDIGPFANFAHWYIDDVAIFGSVDNEPPYFTNTTKWNDTSFTGPFPVRSTITDASGIDSAYLYYRINSGAWQRLVMTHQGSNVYQATIPAQSLNTTVHYYLWARDKWVAPNSGCDPVGAPQDGYYAFYIRPVGMIEQKPETKVITFSVLPNPFKKNLIIRYTIQDAGCTMQDAGYMIPDINLKIYDVSGRIVKSFNLESCIMNHESTILWFGEDDSGRRLSSGVYFVRLEDGDFKKTEKVVLLK